MPLPRFARLPEARRRSLLAAAAAEFAERGVDGASTAGITARAGISKGLLFYYFEGKEDLLGAVLTDLLTRLRPLLSPAAAPASAADFWAALEGIYRRAARLMRAEPVLRALLMRLLAAEPRPELAALLAPAREILRAQLSAARAVGAVHNEWPEALMERVVLGLLLSADVWLLEQLGRPDLDDAGLDAAVAQLLAVYRRALAT